MRIAPFGFANEAWLLDGSSRARLDRTGKTGGFLSYRTASAKLPPRKGVDSVKVAPPPPVVCAPCSACHDLRCHSVPTSHQSVL